MRTTTQERIPATPAIVLLAIAVSAALFPATLHAAITVDNTSTASLAGVSTQLTWSHTVNSGNDRYLVVGISAFQPVASVTYGSQSLTRQVQVNQTSTAPQCEIWSVVAPAVGTDNVTVSFGGNATNVRTGATSFFGVRQFSPVRAFGFDSELNTPTPFTMTANVTVGGTTQAGDMIVDHAAGNGAFGTRTPGAGQTLRYDHPPGGVGPTVSASGSTKTATGAGESTSWTFQHFTPGNNLGGSLAAIALIPAPNADLTVTKQGPTTVVAGTDITYTLSVTNNGPDDADGVTLTDDLPPGTTFVSLTQDSGPSFGCGGPPPGQTGQVACAPGTVPSGTTATFTFVYHVGSDLANGSTLTNTADIASQFTTDPTLGNNTSSTAATVSTSADVSVTKDGPTESHGQIAYDIVVTNNGPSDAQTVALSDILPAGTTFVSLTSPGGWNCTTPAVGTNGTVTCTRATFAPGNATFTLSVQSTAAPGTVINNTATVTSATADPTPGNQSDSAATAILAEVPAIDLRGIVLLMTLLAVAGWCRMRT